MLKSAFIKAAGVSAGLMLVSSAPFAWALSVSPARTEVRLLPGAMTTAVITVSNTHAEPFDVELSEKPWFIYPDNRKIQVDDWLKLPWKRHFRLKPGKSRDVKITIRCPKEALGELMGMVSFAYHAMKPSMITPMISTAVYLEVMGTEKNTGEILALGAGTNNGRFQVAVQIKATGNVRVHPAGTVRLLNDQGQEMAEYIVAESNPIFPGATKDYAGRGPDNLPPAGKYTLAANLHSGTLELKAEQPIKINAKGDVNLEKKQEKEAPKP